MLVCLCILEVFSATFLFRYFAFTARPFLPVGSATVYLVKKAVGVPLYTEVQTVYPQPLYVADEVIGYTTLPGRYKVGFRILEQTYYFNFTVPERGVRLSSYAPAHNSRSIYIFGDSFVLGWGNNDEQTIAWLLQQRLADYDIFNLAQGGYGTTQAVIQYRTLKSKLTDQDILIVSYGDYYLERNYGNPSFIRRISKGVEQRLAGSGGFRDARYPLARVDASGDLAIEYVNLYCGNNNGYCDAPDPVDLGPSIAATKAIIRFFSTVNQKVVLAFISGSDDDPVVAYARQVGIPIADIRLNMDSPEYNDFGVFDQHPAQIAQYNYYQKLLAALIDYRIAVDPYGTTKFDN